jgi:hypothetical protein
MRFLLLFFISFSANSALVCPDRHHCLIGGYFDTGLKSVYQDGDVCTQSLLSDGVCPDYLLGGCAIRGDCVPVLKLIQKKRSRDQ